MDSFKALRTFNMKSYLVFALVAFAIISAVSAQQCPGSCPPQRDPTCGFDGMCLYNFNNGCAMIRYNCQRGGHFRNSSPFQCQSAQNGGNMYQYCRHISGF